MNGCSVCTRKVSLYTINSKCQLVCEQCESYLRKCGTFESYHKIAIKRRNLGVWAARYDPRQITEWM